jgi:multidrug efflux pump subunit AcrA (membrane-fusion protein)
MVAQLQVPEHPGQSFAAKLMNTSNAINSSGAQTAELWIDNADRALQPGAYAEVKFDLPSAPGVLRIPASALITRHSGLAVAVVGPNDRVEIRPITVTRDLGPAVEVAAGVTVADRVIDNPGDTIQTGDQVHVAGVTPQPRGASHG